MPKGQPPKFKGEICNVPIDVVFTCNTLFCPADSNGLVIVKLKRKLEYRGHNYFEPIHLRLIIRILQFLKKNVPLYDDIIITLSNIPNRFIQHNKQNDAFFSGANVLNYVAPDKLIPITIAKFNCDSNEPVIQDALNSISNECAVPISVEKWIIPIEEVGNDRREAKSVEPLI